MFLNVFFAIIIFLKSVVMRTIRILQLLRNVRLNDELHYSYSIV